MFINEGQLCSRMAPKLLEVWCIVTGVIVVMINTSTANVVL